MASIIGWEGGLATCPLNRDNPISGLVFLYGLLEPLAMA